MFNWPAVGASILPNIGGFIGGFITSKSIRNWYHPLKKPAWTPPDYVFGPVWTVLYTSTGYASYMVWRDGGGFEGDARLPLALFGGQLLLNWAWTPVFFGCKNIGMGMCVISALWGAAVTSAVSMYQVNRYAGFIMLPYIAWLSYATALNYKIWRMNPKSKEIGKHN